MKIENIKFKAKRLDNKEWVKGYFYQECGNAYIIENRQKESKLNRNLTYQVDPSTVCQFTGLKDKNGKLIFEGDRVHEYYRHLCIDNYYVVIYSETDGMFGFENEENPDDKQPRCNLLGDLLVIGNKFDREEGEV